MTTLYLFYATIGLVLGFLIFGLPGVFIGTFLGLIYGAGESHRKQNEKLIQKKIVELEMEINKLKSSNL